jgi:hypothetical protein
MAERWMQWNAFAGVRTVERLGLVSLDHDDTYVLAMVSGLGDRRDRQVRIAALRGDAELRETLLWRVFEVEGGGEVSLANVDKFSHPDAGWGETFRVLVADGTLPRDRVLTSCLRALGRDFSAYRVAWFARTYTSLQPTADELAAAQGLIRGLLRASIPATVSFAMRYLTIVDKAGSLEDEEYVAQCASAMAVPAKTASIGAIDLAAKVAGRRPDLAQVVAEAVAHGLEHPHRDVQSRALAVLRRLDARAATASRVDLLEPSVRRVAAEWLGRAPTIQAATRQASPAASSPPLVSQTAVDRTTAERAAALLAGGTDPWEIELLLASLATVASPADELGALRKQARKVFMNPRHAWALRRSVAAVVLAVVGDEDAELDVSGHLLAGRLAEVMGILAGRRRPGVLLATPTDHAGWLDPQVFVARLASLETPPAHHDLVAALLRLSTDGRDRALAAAETLPGEPGAAARYALGGPSSHVRTPSVWVAAARTRAPFDDDPRLIKAGLDGAGQGRAATYGLKLVPKVHRYEERGHTRTVTWWSPSLLVHPAGAMESSDQPTVVAPRELIGESELSSDWIPWAAQIWPHDGETFFALSVADVLIASSTYPEVTYRTAAVLDALLTHPGRLGPMAASVLAAGLSARDVEYRTRAADAFVALMPTARMPAALLADAMTNLAGHCTATRWAATLRDAANASDDAARSVVDLLALLLPQLPHDHPGLHALVATLHEESIRVGSTPSHGALRSWLAGLSGGSKGVKAAKALLVEMEGRRQ